MTDKDGEHSVDPQPDNNPAPENDSRLLRGRYRLDDLVSDGPFAQVWRGYDLQLQRSIAVKLPKPGRHEFADASSATAGRVARISHPGIVPVHETGHQNEADFIVSDFVEGGSLGDYVGRQIVSTDRIIRWMTDVAETLEYCHQNGIVHGDIKPTNILLDLNGRALLSDFGCKQISRNTFDFGPSFGSLKYMSPEQLSGGTIDSRSDFYSLGVVLHELLSGKLPYSSSDPNVLRREIASGATINLPNSPRALRRICAKASQRNPTDRYSSAVQLVDDLRRCSVGSATRRVFIAAMGLIVFIVGFNLSLWWPDAKPQFDEAQNIAAWSKNVATLPAREQVSAVSSKLMELNRGFNGEMKESIEHGVVVGLEFLTDDITDISPVSSLIGLKTLICCGTFSTASNGKLANLSPLKDLKLTSLSCDSNEGIDDLSPLRQMPLTYLNCSRTNVAQLAPLKELPLRVLVCNFTRVSDLAALSDMKLSELYCDHTQVFDLAPLEGMPLEELSCQQTAVADLAPLRHATLHRLECGHTQIFDLSPLKGMSDLSALNVAATKVRDLSPLQELPNLKLLWCDVGNQHDVEILRSFTSVQFINNRAVAAFWAERNNPQPDSSAKE